MNILRPNRNDGLAWATYGHRRTSFQTSTKTMNHSTKTTCQHTAKDHATQMTHESAEVRRTHISFYLFMCNAASAFWIDFDLAPPRQHGQLVYLCCTAASAIDKSQHAIHPSRSSFFSRQAFRHSSFQSWQSLHVFACSLQLPLEFSCEVDWVPVAWQFKVAFQILVFPKRPKI